MAISHSEYESMVKRVESVVPELYASDPGVRAVGMTEIDGRWAFRVTRNTRAILPAAARVSRREIDGLPILYRDVSYDPLPLTKVPFHGPGSPGISSYGREQERHNSLCCGLQIQNFDHDARTQSIANGYITIGTLGCFVKTQSNDAALLTNNHVIAGENHAQKGDQILHPGNGIFNANEKIASLHDFLPLQFSPYGASPRAGNAIFNDADAAIATLDSGRSFVQQCLTYNQQPIVGPALFPQLGDAVYKVGRTSGPSSGTITDIALVLGPVKFDNGDAWFRRVFTIEGYMGTRFSDRGDSGSAIVDANTNKIVGILFAGDDRTTFACPIGPILNQLACSIY